LGRLVDFPVLLRRETDARPVRPAALVGAAEGCRRGPSGPDQFGDKKSRGEDLGLQVRDVLGVDQLVIDGGNGVLPDQLLRRDLRFPRLEERTLSTVRRKTTIKPSSIP